MASIYENIIRLALIGNIIANVIGFMIIRTTCQCISGEVGIWFTRAIEVITILFSLHGILLNLKREYRKGLLDYLCLILFQCFLLGGISILNENVWTNPNTIYTVNIAIVGLAAGSITTCISFLLNTAKFSSEDPLVKE